MPRHRASYSRYVTHTVTRTHSAMSLSVAAQIIIAIGLVNVWVLRYGKPTAWRGGESTNMKEEFAAYGLPEWSVKLVGGLKLIGAALLLAGIVVPSLVAPAVWGIAVLMLGAIAMHFRIGDPPRKSLPAFTMLLLCLVVLFV